MSCQLGLAAVLVCCASSSEQPEPSRIPTPVEQLYHPGQSATSKPPTATGSAGSTGGASSARNRWHALPRPAVPMSWGDLIESREGASATLLPTGKLLILGGGVLSTPSRAAELFDPLTGTFEPVKVPDAPDWFEERAAHTATVLRTGKVLITGGVSLSSRSLYTAWLYDTTSSALLSIP